MGRIWLTSDWHLGHKNIREYEPSRPRNFAEVIIENTRAVLQPGDVLYFLGDLAFIPPHRIRGLVGDLFEMVPSYFVRGNHDKRLKLNHILDLGFEEVFPEYVIEGDALLSHFPLDNRDPRYDEQVKLINDEMVMMGTKYNFHGHTHSKFSKDPRCINVCVEANGFAPLDMDEAIAKREAQVQASLG